MNAQFARQLPPISDRTAHHLLPPLTSESEQNYNSLRWAQRFGLLPTGTALMKAAQIRVDELARVTFPSPDPVAQQICTDLLMWFFLADDQFDERALGASFEQMEGFCEGLLTLLKTGSSLSADSPLGHSLLDLRSRLLDHLPAEWLPRFICNMERYLSGCVVEAINRELGCTPSRLEYRDIRRASVGTYPCFDVIELNLSAPLSSAIADHPQLAALRDVASDVIAWINDLVSLRKESAYNDSHNIIPVLMAEEGLSQAAAIQATHGLIDAQLQEFTRLQSELRLSHQDPVVWEYVAGLESWITGVKSWSYQSQRYTEDYVRLSRRAKHELVSVAESCQ